MNDAHVAIIAEDDVGNQILTIPDEILDELGLSYGDEVTLTVEDGAIIVTKL